jgi:hypothetical protein
MKVESNLKMSARPVGRLVVKPRTPDCVPKLKSKLDAIQDKYNEFISNCSNMFEEEPKSRPKLGVEANRRREALNDNIKEL